MGVHGHNPGRLATSWEGVSLDALLADVEMDADYALVRSYGGYTTNRQATSSRVPFRLRYSVRTPRNLYYADELRRRNQDDPGLDVTVVYTHAEPDTWPRQPQRINLADLGAARWPADGRPRCYVCGPTGFLETVAAMLVTLGQNQHEIRTERFGPSGG